MSSKRRLKTVSSAENSRGSTSLHSDSEDGGSTNSGKAQKQISSAALCASLGLNDVELDWSEADYQNLTTYNIFVRMVKPQLSAANNRISQATMTTILEAKWREFQESNPFKKKSGEKGKADSSTECDDDEDIADQSQNGEAEEINSSSHSPRTIDHSENDDEEQQEDDDDAEEEEEEEESKSRRSQGLKIKLSIKPLRKSSRESRSRKTVMSDKDFEKMLESGEESGSEADAEKERKKRKRKRLNSDSDDGNSEAYRRDRKKRGRKQLMKKDHSGSDEESSGMDGENFEHQKKKEKKKKRTESDDQEGESSQHASNSEESCASSDSAGQRRKKKKVPTATLR